MTTSKLRISILGAVLALAAVTTSPVLAGSRRAVVAQKGDGSALAVELARGVVGQRDVYAPTGESIDLTLNVVASRLPH
jgi:hypothetical protein